MSYDVIGTRLTERPEWIVREVGAGQVRRGDRHPARGRGGIRDRDRRQREEAGHRHVLDTVPGWPCGSEIAQVDAGYIVLAHELAELEQPLSPVQAGIDQHAVALISAGRVLAHIREKMRVVRCNVYDQPYGDHTDGKTHPPLHQ